MKCGIVIYPAKVLQDEVNNLRKRYDPEYALIKPHITLKTKFDADKNLLSKLTDELNEITKNIQPFDINIKKVSSFQPVSNKIYFKIEPNDNLEKLHDSLYNGVLPKEKFITFVPHITIAHDLNTDEFSDIYTTLSMKDYNYTDTLDSLEIGYESDDGSWKTYKSFNFGG
ncbi:MAG TPA: 2'-5' RNA ligase family protein [Pseudogracilibacillus sp.]|nr:2'-5' RNA ligase family protein [Pseudogracilibacillus sp.]